MREKERIKRICNKLQKLWEQVPQQRLGQMLENYIFHHGERGDATSVKLFYQEDKYTEQTIDRMLKKVKMPARMAKKK